MMIKKKLGLLAASVLVASGANAAIDAGGQNFGANGCDFNCWAGTDSDVVFFAHDSSDVNGSYFANLTALSEGVITVDSILAGGAFSQDVGADFSLYDTWGIFATSNDIQTTYSYQKAGVALGGILANSGAPVGGIGGAENTTDSTGGFNNAWIAEINAAVAGNEGAVATGDAADFNNSIGRSANPGTNLVGLSDTANLFLFGILDTTPEGNFPGAAGVGIDELSAFHSLLAGVSVDGQYVGINSAVIPVPAAAWLFGSALLGLGVVRRK